MPHITDNFVAVAAAWEINERLVYHCLPGNMLAGLHLDKEGTLKVDGMDDLPLLQPWAINMGESLFQGAPRPGGNLNNQPTAETLTLTYRVAVARKHGFLRRDPTNATQQKGLLDWLALIRDAIETEAVAGGQADACFQGAAVKPVTFRVNETETTQLAFHTFLEVVVEVKPVCRAERHFTLNLDNA